MSTTKLRVNKLLSLLLLVSMVISMMPISAIAVGETYASGEIVSFAPLDEEIAIQSVPFGADKQGLNLPNTLDVTALVQKQGDPFAAEPEIISAYVTVPVMEWFSVPEYDPETADTYVFMPVLGNNWPLAAGLEAPYIIVTVEADAAITPQLAPMMVTMSADAPDIYITNLPKAKLGKTYSVPINASGTAPLTWSVIEGEVDFAAHGFTLDPNTGVISGEPVDGGRITFTVKAQNSFGHDTQEISLETVGSDYHIQVGDIVYYGSYPQVATGTTPPSGGRYVTADIRVNLEGGGYGMGTGYFVYEPIAWRVLENDNGTLLLMSEYLLETLKGFSGDHPCWKTSGMRSWLNGYNASFNDAAYDYSVPGTSFLSNAFSTWEQEQMISSTLMTMHWDEYWVIDATKGIFDANYRNIETVDKVFLLSPDEAKNPDYGFPSDGNASSERVAINTGYAGRAYYTSQADSTGNPQNWWLRTQPMYPRESWMSGVTADGSVNGDENNVDNAGVAWGNIRPVLRVSEDAVISETPLPAEGAPPRILTTSLKNAAQGIQYSVKLNVAGEPPITWSVESGALPDGMTLDAQSGVISGRAAALGLNTFTVKAENANGFHTKELSIEVLTAEALVFDLLLDDDYSPENQAGRQAQPGVFGKETTFINVPSEMYVRLPTRQNLYFDNADLVKRDEKGNIDSYPMMIYDKPSGNDALSTNYAMTPNPSGMTDKNTKAVVSVEFCNDGTGKKNMVANLYLKQESTNVGEFEYASPSTYELYVQNPKTGSETHLSGQVVAPHYNDENLASFPHAPYIPSNLIDLAAGDVNGDGYDELFVIYQSFDGGLGASQTNCLYLSWYFRNSDGNYIYHTSSAPLYKSSHTAQMILASIACGDLHGDGYDDIVISASSVLAPRNNDLGTKRSPYNKSTQLFQYNGYKGVLTVDAVFTTAQMDTSYIQVGDMFGTGIDIVDVNADGYDDLILGGYTIYRDDDGWSKSVAVPYPILQPSTPQGRLSDFYSSSDQYYQYRPTIVTYLSHALPKGVTKGNDRSVVLQFCSRNVFEMRNHYDDIDYNSADNGPLKSAASITAYYDQGRTQMPKVFFERAIYSSNGNGGWSLYSSLMNDNEQGKNPKITPATSSSKTLEFPSLGNKNINMFTDSSIAFDARGVSLNDPYGTEVLVVRVQDTNQWNQTYRGAANMQGIYLLYPEGILNAEPMLDGLGPMYFIGYYSACRALSVAFPDTDTDAIKLVLKDKSMYYSDPVIIAGLFSPPYFKDFDHHSNPGELFSGYLDDLTVSYTQTKSQSQGSSSSLGVSAGVYFGLDQDISVLGVKVASFEFETEISAGYTSETGNMLTTSESIGAYAAAGDDVVLMSTVPYDYFEYDMYAPDTNGNYPLTPTRFTVNVPYKPVIKTVGTEEYTDIYNATLNKLSLPRPDDLFDHTMGEPLTYPSATQIKSRPGSKVGDSPFAPGSSSSGVTASFATETSTEISKTVEKSVDIKIGGGVASVKAGITQNTTWGNTKISANSINQEYSLEVAGLPAEVRNLYGIAYKPAYYVYKCSDGSSFPVVTTVVSNVKQPAFLPSPDSLSVVGRTNSSVTIAWAGAAAGNPVKAYEVYNYNTITGEYRLLNGGTITAVPGKSEYTYTLGGLSDNTPVNLAIRTVDSAGNKSWYSKTVRASTQQIGVGEVSITMSARNTDTGASITISDGVIPAGQTTYVTLSAKVTQAAQATRTMCYWQKQAAGGGYTMLGGLLEIIQGSGVKDYDLELPDYGVYRLAYIQEDSSGEEYTTYSEAVELRPSTVTVDYLEIVNFPTELAAPAGSEFATIPLAFVGYNQNGNALALDSASYTWTVTLPNPSVGYAYDNVNKVLTVSSQAAVSGDQTVTVTVAGNGKSVTQTMTVKRVQIPQSVTASGSSANIGVPGVGQPAKTRTYTVSVTDQYGQKVSNPEIFWQLKAIQGGDRIPWPAGLSMEGNTLSVSPEAYELVASGNRSYYLYASAGSVLSAPLALTLAQEAATAVSIVLTSGAASDTPLTDVINLGSGADAMETIGVNAYVYDQYGHLMSSPNITWNLKGLSNQSSGMRAFNLNNGASATQKVVNVTSSSNGYKIYELSLSSGSASKAVTIVQSETLAKVNGVAWSGSTNTVTWSAVSGASGYAIDLMKMNGSNVDQMKSVSVASTATSYDLSSLLATMGTGTYRVQVQAMGSAASGYVSGEVSVASSSKSYTLPAGGTKQPLTITVSGDQSATSGGTAKVRVILSADSYVTTGQLDLTYDTSLLEYDAKVNPVFCTPELLILNKVTENTPGTIRIGFLSTAEITAGVILVELTFKVKQGVEGVAAINIVPGNCLFYDKNSAGVSTTTYNGTVAIAAGGKLGDVNGDSSVTMADVQELFKHIMNGTTSQLPLVAADVNKNGEITMADVQELFNGVMSGVIQ